MINIDQNYLVNITYRYHDGILIIERRIFLIDRIMQRPVYNGLDVSLFLERVGCALCLQITLYMCLSAFVGVNFCMSVCLCLSLCIRGGWYV